MAWMSYYSNKICGRVPDPTRDLSQSVGVNEGRVKTGQCWGAIDVRRRRDTVHPRMNSAQRERERERERLGHGNLSSLKKLETRYVSACL
jgi:hypothetical protein